MAYILELFTSLFLFYKIWTVEDRTELFMCFFTACIMLFPSFPSVRIIPPIKCLVPTICLIRIAFRDKTIKESWNQFPLKYIFLVLLTFHFIQPLFVKYDTWYYTYKYIIYYTTSTYLYFFVGFCIAPDIKEILQKKNWIIAWIGILFIIAFTSWSINYNFISNELNDINVWTSEMKETNRGFRVTGPVDSPMAFGFINVLLALLIYQLEVRSSIKYALIVLVFVNLFFSASRAPLLGLITSTGVHMLFISKRKILSTFISLFPILILSFCIFGTNTVTDNYINTFTDLIITGGENTGGSSMDLRERQMAVATGFAINNPIWGRGNGATYEMTRNRDTSVDYDTDLAGAEGYLFVMLIDYGYIYIGLIVLFYTYLLYLFIKKRTVNDEAFILGISSTIALLTHLFSSRPDDTWQIFMPVMGACLYTLIASINYEIEIQDKKI